MKIDEVLIELKKREPIFHREEMVLSHLLRWNLTVDKLGQKSGSVASVSKG